MYSLIRNYAKILALFLFAALGRDSAAQNQDKPAAGKIIEFNRFSVPVNESGILGFSRSNSQYTPVFFDSLNVIWSTGFLMSGYNDNGELWSNGAFGLYNIRDYQRGTVESGPGVLGQFYVSRDSEPFGREWAFWNAAVDLGAEYYDGDKDGEYYPVDKNDNGLWDPDEDAPGILGDVISFSVFNDGVKQNKRRILGVIPQGINIKQSIWGYNKDETLSKVIFFKYEISNSGKYHNKLTDVVFSLVADPDIAQDLMGYDTDLETAFLYYNRNQPGINDYSVSLHLTLLQGPIQYTGNPEDLAFRLVGNELKTEKLSGYVNKGIENFGVSFNPYDFDMKEFIRNLITGEYHYNPCDSRQGVVIGQSCYDIDHHFLFSGDPVGRIGWLDNRINDQAFILSTEEFDLVAGEPVEIILAYIVGTGETGIDAYADAREINFDLKNLYFENPSVMPDPDPIVITDEESIELIWETSSFLDYRSRGYGYDLVFEGFEVYMYRSLEALSTNDPDDRELVALYDLDNGIDRLLALNPSNRSTEVEFENGTQINPQDFTEEANARIILKIKRDPFTNGPLVKGRPYFLSINSFALNSKDVVQLDVLGNYIYSKNKLGIFRNEPKIINDGMGNEGIVVGEHLNDSFFRGIEVQHISGNSEAVITYDVYDKSELKDHTYEISFQRAGSDVYDVQYFIEDLYTGDTIYYKGSTIEDYGLDVLTDGFKLHIPYIKPEIRRVEFSGGTEWFKEFNNISTGVFYTGRDVEKPSRIYPIDAKQSRAVSFDKLRKVDIVFGDTAKAYRYVRHAVRYNWMGRIHPDSGYVPIPLSAYSYEKDGSKKKLAVGFLENDFINSDYRLADGKWNPGDYIQETKEYLIIFPAEYPEDPYTHLAYTGSEGRWADVAHGYSPNISDDRFSDSLFQVARSPYFDAMYVIGFEMEYYNPEFNPAGILTIEPTMVLSENDKYVFKVKREKTKEEFAQQFQKINVFPNPLFGTNPGSGSFGRREDEPFVTFINLPPRVTVKIFSLSGNLIRTLRKNDLASMVRWDLENEHGYRAASGVYIALVENPEFGQKILKFSIIMPQKRVQY